ncbi:MAG: MBL fold metallo-hydrolase [Caldilineaceae bacterium]
MKLNDDLYVLPLPSPMGNPLNVSLIVDALHGPTLVDTGLPRQRDAINTALAEADLPMTALKRIILTHQDVDHVGSLHDLVDASGARVLASPTETPYIDGADTPRFLRPEMLAQRPQLHAVAAIFQYTPVNEQLADGMRLDLAGGVRVIATPGHTPGHISLYLERTKTLITGDALTADAGHLQGPNQSATPDWAQAVQSVQKLAALDVQTIVCYHGGVVQDDANGQLQRVAQELLS